MWGSNYKNDILHTYNIKTSVVLEHKYREPAYLGYLKLQYCYIITFLHQCLKLWLFKTFRLSEMLANIEYKHSDSATKIYMVYAFLVTNTIGVLTSVLPWVLVASSIKYYQWLLMMSTQMLKKAYQLTTSIHFLKSKKRPFFFKITSGS